MDGHRHDNPGMNSPPPAGQPHPGVMMASSFEASAMMQAMFNNPLSASKPVDMPAGPMFHNDGGIRMQQQQQHGSSGMLVASEQGKKKRGRPRKYAADGAGNNVGMALSPVAAGYSGPPPAAGDASTKRRGRPPGSGKKKQMDALGSAGTSFTPHLIIVNPNEDVASKIVAFSQQGPRTTCVISANGSLSAATLRQPVNGIVNMEGSFEIISLSGSFVPVEDGSTGSKPGGLSVALASPDGCIIGGSVAGMLVAATPVQVVLGSFVNEKKKQKPEAPKEEPSFTPGLGASSAVSPPSEGTSSDPSDDPGSPVGHNSNACIGSSQHFSSPYTNISWGLAGNPGRYDPNLRMMSD